MNFFIFGFHRWVWGPKFPPASSNSLIATPIINYPPVTVMKIIFVSPAEKVIISQHKLQYKSNLCPQLCPPPPPPPPKGGGGFFFPLGSFMFIFTLLPKITP